MTHQQFMNAATVAWIVFLAYWFLSAQRLKAVKKREPPWERAMQVISLGIAYLLLFSDFFRIPDLYRRVLPVTIPFQTLGLTLSFLGIAFAIWARRHLGENWSATVTLKKDHELIRSGPYRRIRHPIYTGMLLSMFGTAMIRAEVCGFIALAIALIAFYFKARKEERYLIVEFGPKFAEHKTQTGMFLPRLNAGS